MPKADNRISSLPLTGTVVTHAVPSNVVVEHDAAGLNTILPSETGYVNAPWGDAIVIWELLKKTVAPAAGTPSALKFALNQM
jgi:hypothetical protein